MKFRDIVQQLNETEYKEATTLVNVCKNKKCRNNSQNGCTRAFVVIGEDGTCRNIK